MVKKWAVFSLTSFSAWKYDFVTKTKQILCHDCSTVRLLRFFHSGAVTNVPQGLFHMLQLFHSGTVMIVRLWDCYVRPQWHCHDCSSVRLLKFSHSDTVLIFPWWHCYKYSELELSRLFHCETVTTFPHCNCYHCSIVRLLRFFHSGTVTNVPQGHCYML